ncbi:MAG: ribonuclease P protein component [Burkholderiaceae bacterium]
MSRRSDRPKNVASDNYGFARTRRLKTPAEYEAVLHAPRTRSIRAARRWLSMIAAYSKVNSSDANSSAGDVGRIRFGITVGKRNAPRAVDRVLIKRIVREACRHQASAFERWAGQASMDAAVTLRLKSPLVDGGQPLAMRQWRRQIRIEADELLQQALSELQHRDPLKTQR